MNLIKPKALQKPSTIAFLSVAGNIEDINKLSRAKVYFEEAGYKVITSETTFMPNNYLSDTDEARLNALHDFFANDEIDAIIATRGGYGSIRIINQIDYDIIRRHPKIFIGYSDITALLLMIYKKTGLTTFHGPMAYSDFSDNINQFTQDMFFTTLENNIETLSFTKNKLIYKAGIVEGILWGGNLTTIASMCGVDFIPDEKFILFIEEINEPVYKIDRALTQLLNINKFKNNLSGIILGDFSCIDNSDYFNAYYREIGNKLDIPIVSGLITGHCNEKLTIPIGVNCELDTSKNYILLKDDYIS